MHRTIRQVLWLSPGVVLCLVWGCSQGPGTIEQVASTEENVIGQEHDPARCGRLTGRVCWTGPIPPQEPFSYLISKAGGVTNYGYAANPHQPRIDPKTGGLGEAVVFLRGVNPAQSKPWDLPEPEVEMLGRGIHIRQGERVYRAGFVRRGASIRMVSKDPHFHNLRARGAAYFSLAFPVPDQPRQRRFDQAGVVHFTSGAGFYWASAYLFVDDLPYYTHSDVDGRFLLTGIPEGTYEVVAWHPNPSYSHQERDPESTLITRQRYGEPLRRESRVTIRPGETSVVEFQLGAKE